MTITGNSGNGQSGNGQSGKSESGLNADGGCAVDWSWLAGERIASITSGLDFLTITFESGLVWKTKALLWQGKPFLAFDPYQAPTPDRP